MPGRDGTGPLGMGPCGKSACACKEKHAARKKKAGDKAKK
ncbi:MAG TPA: DUF5320 domain-containing protein [Methanocella sp.]|nr:DUF5320 domain-containing protein [Methanocella sp.]HTY91298.1 DUF5320 domain-containing protein [Methanocella sp.]